MALIALISLNFRSVKVMQIAFFAKFYRFENWTVFTSPAGRRTSCACVRDGFCKRVFVTVFYKRVFVTVFTSPADATPVADGYRR